MSWARIPLKSIPRLHSALTSSNRSFGNLEVLIVQDMFLSETARRADIVLPALSAYEKDGTMTNTAGEIQLVRKGGDFMGPRSDFDILRILSHQLAAPGCRAADSVAHSGSGFRGNSRSRNWL